MSIQIEFAPSQVEKANTSVSLSYGSLYKEIENHLDRQQACQTKRALILMADTGGGHRAAAEAIQEGLYYLYGNSVSVTIVDAWKNHAAWPINRLSDTYSWVVNEALWLYKGFWLLGKKPGLVDFLLKLLYPWVESGLLALFKNNQPDVIISVHPLITLFPLMVLKRAKLNIPFITVVTDMVNGYPSWYHPETTLCLVSTEPARDQALSFGISPAKVHVTGQPAALKFGANIGGKAYLRSKLGLDLNRPVALLVGGAEGYGHIDEIARSIARCVPYVQLAIVTGHNRRLRAELEAVAWPIPTTIFGFVSNMHELMSTADVLITKAGPNTISEAFIAKLPVILYSYIPGQEDGNVSYVTKHNAGVYEPDPEKVARLVFDWLQPDNPTLASMAQCASHLACPEAALTIARRIYELIPQPHAEQQTI